jgi:outer membrane protein assembly factor BamB
LPTRICEELSNPPFAENEKIYIRTNDKRVLSYSVSSTTQLDEYLFPKNVMSMSFNSALKFVLVAVKNRELYIMNDDLTVNQ